MKRYIPIPEEEIIKRNYEKAIQGNTKLVDENRLLKEEIKILREEVRKEKEKITGEKNAYNRMYNMYTELQERIDKAIEYIEHKWKEKGYYEDIDNCLMFYNMNEFEKEELLSILRGEDKE